MRVKTDEKRLEILQVAAKVFGQNGYHGASMSAISAELGGSKATLYGYYSSKEELFAAVLMQSLDDQGTAVFRIFEDRDNDDLAGQLKKFGRDYLDFITDQETMALFRSAVSEDFEGKLSQLLYKNGQGRGWGEVEDFMALKMQQGAISGPSAQIVSLHLKGLLESGVAEPIMYRCPPLLDFDLAVDAAVDAFMNAYGGAG
ncbi:transcriptional regulator, TetR family [Cohaesibacter marisflavi]|uniref:Transcriptional regulator, TetR family n=1 Tax=Cohaesibacter marisflavi TaxID=655353 RepID=A0A1I5HFW4_9HYPH|nr:TetR/AcrR family transcriptional regulator [Cohaesibacter marisflavi]SFO47145.1 transcriptional regulator, TetR family [Cohaesibacter marisflavi]